MVFCKSILDEDVIADKAAYINEQVLLSAKELMGQSMNIPLGASIGCAFAPDEGADFVEGFIAGDQAKRILDILEEVYRKANKGSQELLAIKLTNAIAADQQEELEEYVRSKSFFHEKTKRVPSAPTMMAATSLRPP